MSVALELQDLRCVRGSRLLFAGLSASVRTGHVLRVLGPNGAGKTTLLRTLCGLAQPEHGRVLWRGRSITSTHEAFQQELVYLGHAPALKDDLSALENLRSSCELAGLRCSATERRTALVDAGLEGREHLPVRLLSQGQRRRAALARLALDEASALWVLDEPFSALDEAACGWLWRLVAAQLGRDGIVVLTTHQPPAPAASHAEVRITLRLPEAPGRATARIPAAAHGSTGIESGGAETAVPETVH